jgi:two-component system, sensor histidine kinase and response regulator
MTKITASLSELPRLFFHFKNEEVSHVVRRLLELDFTITTKSGEEPLNQNTLGDYDLVVIDGDMDLLKTLRSNPLLVDLPILVMSSPCESALQVQALDIGANDVVVMPLGADILKARIRRLVKTKRRSDEQRQVITFLKTAYEKKDRFLQIVTHDLKNPVNNIRLAHYFLQTELTETPSNKEALTTIEMAIETMTDLITNFLDTAALEKGKTQLHLEPTIMEDLIWEVVSRYSETANAKNITLLMGETEGEVLVDPNRFMQIMSNLVSNAIKFSPNDRFVTISSIQEADQVRLMVTDEGPGIPANEQSALFEPFSKLSPRPTNGESSTGLGLSIVKELVLLHNGKVGLDSEENAGCTFWVELPVYKPQPQAIAS